jgi:magnesium transporter
MFRILDVGPTGNPSASTDHGLVARPALENVRWIDLEAQDIPQLELLEKRFGFHPLTLEDCLHFDQRSKLEAYGDHLFVVVHGFVLDSEECHDGSPLELHMFIGKNFMVTVHQEPIERLEIIWKRMLLDGDTMRRGPDFACYLLIDSIVDGYFPILDQLASKADELEDRVLDEHQEVELAEIFGFKRLLVKLRKVLSPQRDVLALLSKRGEGWIGEHTSIYFRDVYDHVLRLTESVEATRDLIGNALDAYLWSASQRTNEIMKRLTLLSAIFLPLTFITGFFGQNFDYLPFGAYNSMLVMMITCLALPVGMILYFIRSKWF